MSERGIHERAAELFLEAVRVGADWRAAFLDESCGDNAELRAKVELLLGVHEADNVPTTLAGKLASVHERPREQQSGADTRTFGTAAGVAQSDYRDEQAGDRIGRYTLLELIGQGGFGRVWVAEQREPVQRRVALKVIKAGMDTREVVARFEQERQALALMDHPNIAKVFDAGVALTGRPYFVMELCKGDAISTYCDKQRLDIAERLELFAQVCTAMQHAHTKGVIHRDIKPNNVLVFTQDGRPQAKIIDFGIAKAIESRLTERTLFTEHRQLIGTPAYMSPEQADGNLDIDTRSDVYSLGVLLYELLTGSTPFSTRELLSAAFGEMQRIIREIEPPLPSTRLNQSRDTIASVAASRRTEPRRLGLIVRGELDWIVMKSLEKDRARRYESASALAEDVRRYLAGEAVVAAPPGSAYLLRKFLRRHKGLVAAATTVAVTLLIGAGAFAWQAQVARSERDRAVAAESEARQRANELQQVSDFQSQMLAEVDATAAGLRLTKDVQTRLDEALKTAGVPDEERSAQATAFASAWSRINSTNVALELINATILRPALSAIDKQFADQPVLNATLRAAIGARYLDLGLVEESRAVTEQVLSMRRDALGEDNPDTIATLLGKCKALSVSGKQVEAEAILRPLIEKHRSRLGLDDPQLLTAHDYLGEALCGQDRHVEAEPLIRTALAGRRRVLGDDHEYTLASIGNLAVALRGQGRLSEAEACNREGLERRQRVFGDDHLYTLGSYNNIATIYVDQGRYQEAEVNFRKVIEGRRRVLGELHRDTLVATGNLAATLERMGRQAEAESVQRDLLERTRRVLGPDHPDALIALSNLASNLTSVGKFTEAEPLCREALDRRLRIFGPNHSGTITSHNVMGYLMRRMGKNTEAEPFLRQALEASAKIYGDDHPERLILLLNMGTLARDLGRPEESERYLREAVERCGRVLGAAHPHTQTSTLNLSSTLLAGGKFSEVIELLGAAEPAFRKASASSNELELRALLLRLGKSRTAIGDFAAAQANLVEAHAIYSKTSGATDKRTRDCVQALVDLYRAWHAAEPGSGYGEKVMEWSALLTLPDSQPASGPQGA